MPTSELLQTAAAIAARFEGRGQTITATEAIDRATAALEQLRQLKAMRDLDWADTLRCPESMSA